jgi:recombinational DNA repair ATPase RecF
LIRQIVKIEPVILADDLFAELDSGRAKDALERVSVFGQAFITCAQKPPQGDYVLLESDRWANQNR